MRICIFFHYCFQNNTTSHASFGRLLSALDHGEIRTLVSAPRYHLFRLRTPLAESTYAQLH